MSIHVIKSSKLVQILPNSLQFSLFLTISTGSIEKPSDITFSIPHISKQLKELELTSIQPKYMQTFTTLDKELETKQKIM